MKILQHISSLILLLFIGSSSFAQLNMNALGSIDIPSIRSTGLNDIWGYVDEVGNEYALVGTEDGVSIVDVTDPSTPTEVFWTPGMNSIWRDLKTYGDYCYVTTEALEGLMIIDMSGLPGDTDLPVTIYDGPDGDPWLSAHNLYMDDGYVYIFGAGRDNGGVIILDVATDPANPVEVGVFDNWYCHDGYVVDNIGYFAHIYDGFFSVVDLTDKSAPILLGTAITPTNFSHNIWASEDGNYVYTTDEVSGGYIGSFDVSNPLAIQELDRIQSSPGNGIVPHNSHVLGNYLYTSYYTYGVVVHDITYPNNMVEVAFYDTSPLSSPSTEGCWGAYPYLPSGNILATDRQTGLFICSADLHQGSYLEGTVTEFGSGITLNNVEITIDGTSVTDFSNVLGDYATGIEGEGSIDVTYFKVLYFPQTISTPFENGVIFEQDVELEKIPEFEVNIKVLDAVTMDPIEGANVLLEHTYLDHEGITNAAGEVAIPLYYQDNYQLYAGKWGHVTNCFVDTMITDEIMEITILLDKGIADDFTFDFGWNASGSAARGFWEREIPVGVGTPGETVENPFTDVGFDCGQYAYLTGNGTTNVNTEEVNDGEVLLLSPTFDLTDFTTPHINYSTWFFCLYGAEPDDTLEVYLLNGLGDIELIDQHYNGGLPMSQWNANSIDVSSVMPLTANMQLLVILSDYVETENVTEGGIDNFSVTNFSVSGINEESIAAESGIILYPNPFNNRVSISGVTNGELTVYDVSGRLVTTLPIAPTVELPEMEPGTYFFVVTDAEGNQLDVFTQIKN